MNLAIILSSVLAGLLQGVTGFGSGIILMIFLPMYYSMPRSAALSNAICLFLSIYIIIRTIKNAVIKDVIIPFLVFFVANTASIYAAPYINQILLKKLFGVFLILLAIYYLFFSKSEVKYVSKSMSILFFLVSGVCNGLFAIGGPLMMIYYLTKYEDFKVYYATIQLFFCVNNVFSTFVRIYNGLLYSSDFIFIIICATCVIIFTRLGNKVMDKLDSETLKKLTYVIILLSGITNLF